MAVPVVVDYADLSVVRSRTNGFVQHVHVVDGQQVAEGQLLLELENHELKAEQQELEMAVEQQRVRHRTAIDEQNAAQAQVALRNLEALEERLDEARRSSSGLQVRALAAGRIVARNLEQTIGLYVREGEELLAVGDEDRKELLVSVGQEEIDQILPRIGSLARFRIGSRPARRGTLETVKPRASMELPHPAMASTVGGSLAVKERETAQSELRLVEARFRGIISLSPEVCHDLGSGERGYTMLGLRRESIGEFAWVRLIRWLETLFHPASA